MSDQSKSKNAERSEADEVTSKRRKLSRLDFLKIASAAGIGVVTADVVGNPTPAKAAGKKTKIDTPTITCGTRTQASIDITVCAPSGTGATGLPAGFSIQWMT